MAARVLVSGASGPIGQALLPVLRQQGFEVSRLTRSAPGQGEILWDPARPLDPRSVTGYDAVVHLAGESIVGRWTEAKKRRIQESRVAGTRHLAEAVAKAAQRPSVFVSASAIGYYGDRGDEVLRENSSPGRDFLSAVCRDWEASAQPAAQAGIRTVPTRFGLILSAVGGALPKMLPPFRIGAGGNMGNGRQWWSWIHINDVVGAILHVIRTHSLAGPVNVVGPKPVTNAEFTQALARALHRPAFFPLPAFVARLAFGQMADELLLASQKVEPDQLVASGYRFQYADLGPALDDLLPRKTK
jgi:uncharacterized protein (TIGR01777 family)